jgi:hypothetical protein
VVKSRFIKFIIIVGSFILVICNGVINDIISTIFLRVKFKFEINIVFSCKLFNKGPINLFCSVSNSSINFIKF